jgi:hypothetical protein
MITFNERAVWGWIMRDDLTHRYAKIDRLGTSNVFVVVTWDGTRMVFDSLEEAKAWASIALRT